MKKTTPGHIERAIETLLKALEPSRKGYTEAIYSYLRANTDASLKRFVEVYNCDSNNEDFRYYDARSRADYAVRKAQHDRMVRFTEIDEERTKQYAADNGLHYWDRKAPKFRKLKSADVIDAMLRNDADKQTEHDFAGYACKLAGKIGKEVESAEVVGSLWSHSVLHVVIAEDFWADTEQQETQKWKTQMILNVSKLGNVFNQWPTRQMK